MRCVRKSGARRRVRARFEDGVGGRERELLPPSIQSRLGFLWRTVDRRSKGEFGVRSGEKMVPRGRPLKEGTCPAAEPVWVLEMLWFPSSRTGTEPEIHHFSKIDGSSSSSKKKMVFYSDVTLPELELNRNYIVALIPVLIPVPVKNGTITPLVGV